jgi:hypothetical protein
MMVYNNYKVDVQYIISDYIIIIYYKVIDEISDIMIVQSLQ